MLSSRLSWCHSQLLLSIKTPTSLKSNVDKQKERQTDGTDGERNRQSDYYNPQMYGSKG